MNKLEPHKRPLGPGAGDWRSWGERSAVGASCQLPTSETYVGIRTVKTLAINLLTSIDPNVNKIV
ncbi:hypothetical protein E2C01_066066 [Portunus trituberculatus]|uniref:Uncharacterized protein n=1 Tax=Portunus trituberculatus TaxID=210409 RepID=A0A5B7HRA9_PORTR|nr:hypothetical protein [Portunus trituberculatus]